MPEKPPARARSILPLLAALAAMVVLVVGGVVWMTRPGGPAAVDIGGPFTLLDGGGKTVTDADFRGHYMLVYFGYTSCPDVCPTTLNDMMAALDTLGAKAALVQPVFITIDPKRDTPPVIGKYVASFGPHLVGLTGTPEQIAAVARAYRVYYAEHRTGPGADDYTMDHSSILYLMAPDGAFRAIISTEPHGSTMADDIGKQLTS